MCARAAIYDLYYVYYVSLGYVIKRNENISFLHNFFIELWNKYLDLVKTYGVDSSIHKEVLQAWKEDNV